MPKPILDQIYESSIKSSKRIVEYVRNIVSSTQEAMVQFGGMAIDLGSLKGEDYDNVFSLDESDLKKNLSVAKKAFDVVLRNVERIEKELKNVAEQRKNFELIGEDYLTAFGVKMFKLSDELSVEMFFGKQAEAIAEKISRQRTMWDRWLQAYELLNSYTSFEIDRFTRAMNKIESKEAVIYWDVRSELVNLRKVRRFSNIMKSAIGKMTTDVMNVFKLKALAKGAKALAKAFD